MKDKYNSRMFQNISSTYPAIISENKLNENNINPHWVKAPEQSITKKKSCIKEKNIDDTDEDQIIAEDRITAEDQIIAEDRITAEENIDNILDNIINKEIEQEFQDKSRVETIEKTKSKDFKEKTVSNFKEKNIVNIVKHYEWPAHRKWFYIKDNLNDKRYINLYSKKLKKEADFSNYFVDIKWSNNYVVAKLIYGKDKKMSIAFTKGKIIKNNNNGNIERILVCDGIKGIKDMGIHLSIVQWHLHLMYDAYVRIFRHGIKADKVYIPTKERMIDEADKVKIKKDNTFYERMERNYIDIPKAIGFKDKFDKYWVMNKREAKQISIKKIDISTIYSINKKD